MIHLEQARKTGSLKNCPFTFRNRVPLWSSNGVLPSHHLVYRINLASTPPSPLSLYLDQVTLAQPHLSHPTV